MDYKGKNYEYLKRYRKSNIHLLLKENSRQNRTRRKIPKSDFSWINWKNYQEEHIERWKSKAFPLNLETRIVGTWSIYKKVYFQT